MAQKVLIQLVDDLDGTPLAEGGSTVEFGLDGARYEIDLSEANAAVLREALAPYVRAGRKVASAAGARRRRSAPSGGAGNASAIRAWARSQGIAVSERGRVPAELAERYRAAH